MTVKDIKRSFIRALTLALAGIMLISSTGCSIKNSTIESKKVLVESTEDQRVLVEDGVTTSNYDVQKDIYASATSKDEDSVTDGALSSGTTTEPEVKDLKLNLNRYKVGDESGYNLKVSDYIKDISVHSQYFMFGDDFKLDNGIGSGWGTALNYDTYVKSTKFYNLGVPDVICYTGAREFVNTFFLPSNEVVGDGKTLGGGGFPTTPTSDKIAYQMAKLGVLENQKIDISKIWEGMPGLFKWQHYVCEWGCDAVGTEVGAGISAIQLSYAFTRGAARQYQLPWFVQHSFWYTGTINDYTGLNVWGAKSSPYGGKSPSVYRRNFLTTFMSGASHFYPEAGATLNFTSEITPDGVYKLSPVGEMTQQIANFADKNKDTGIGYNPIGIVLDFYHGMSNPNYTVNEKLVFQTFRFTAGDEMNFDLLESLWPDSFLTSGNLERNELVNNPYGDVFDVMLQNASQEVLNSYPCLVMTGDIDFSDEEIKRFENYVNQGGTLVLNTAYLKDFNSFNRLWGGTDLEEIKVGNGNLIIYGPDYDITLLDSILKKQVAKLVPFEFSDNVQRIISIKNGSFFVTVINNDGHQYGRSIYEEDNSSGGYRIDYGKTKNLTIKYKGNLQVKSITEKWYGETLPAGNEITTELLPGDAKVFEFYFG